MYSQVGWWLLSSWLVATFLLVGGYAAERRKIVLSSGNGQENRAFQWQTARFVIPRCKGYGNHATNATVQETYVLKRQK